MDSALTERIDRVLSGLGPALAGPEATGRMTRWLTELRAWNAKMDLTAARGDDELVDLMVADAAVLARLIARAEDGVRTVVDVGSGAGAPGLPLSALRADLEVALVEPLARRVAFLRRVVGGARPTVLRARGEDLAKQGERFDVAISRATLAPEAWLELGARLAPGGEVWLLLAKHDAPEIEGLTVFADERYSWPLTGAARRVVGYHAGPVP